MASVVDICNLALSHLGDSATVSSIDPPEGSAQAEHCARFYPTARDVVLEAHDWTFATRRVALAQAGTPPSAWTYAYALPASCIRVLAVLAPTATSDQDTQDFVEEGGYIYTNQVNAVVRYTTRVTDTTKFSPSFTEALTWLLASYLTGPVLKGDKTAKDWALRMYNISLASARTFNANVSQTALTHSVPWMAKR